MTNRIALVGMCNKTYVDEIIEEIENREASVTIDWNFAIWEEMRDKIHADIIQYGYARFFMYEKKAGGGKGIRVAAHFDSFEDIMVEDCFNGDPCLTRFRIKGYEIFDNPIEISSFKEYGSDKTLKATQGLGQAFGYVDDQLDLKGKDLTVFVRLIWNTDGWQSPSGNANIFTDELYESDYGFGHEEWNFRIEYAVEDKLYGFMMGKPARLYKKYNKPHPTYFYSFDGTSYHIIGSYLESQPVEKEEIERVKKIHSDTGVIEERIDEVLKIIENRKNIGKIQDFDKLSKRKKLRIIRKQLGEDDYQARRYLKCPVDSAIILQDSIVIDDYLLSMLREPRGFPKYDIPLYLRVYPVVLNKDNFPSESNIEISKEEVEEVLAETAITEKEGGSIEPHDASYISYTIKSGTKEYKKNEFDLVDDFRKWLKSRHKITSFKESRQIDIRFEDSNGTVFGVEAKYSEGKMRFPIRSALGQIIEYNFFPGRVPKDHWIILLNRRPKTEERKWVRILKIGVPVSLCWREGDVFTFESNPLE